MNSLHWMAQILLAGVFLFTAAGKLFAYDKLVEGVETRSKGRPISMSRWQVVTVAIAEIVGAVGLLIQGPVEPPHLIVLCSAAWLALLMVAGGLFPLCPPWSD